jgi:arsenite-transporting ATPase
MESVAKLDKATAELRKTLSNPEITTYRVVLQPEKMVMREAERAVSYLGLFNYPVDLAVINRVLPEAAGEGEFFRSRYEIQQKYLAQIEANFAPLPLRRAPYYANEVVGLEALSQLAKDCFGEDDPTQVFHTGRLQEVVELDNGGFLLRLPLPFVDSGAVKLRKRGDELFVTVGNFKREMILPTVLAKRRALSGQLIDGSLEIEFSAPDPEPAEAKATG